MLLPILPYFVRYVRSWGLLVTVAWKALRAYESGSEGFNDAIIAYANMAHECEYTVTSDRRASRLDGVRLLK